MCVFLAVCIIVESIIVVVGQYSSKQLSPQPQCGMPVSLSGMLLNPYGLLGTWYEYMYRTPPYLGRNPRYIYTPLRVVQLPGSTQQALAVSWVDPAYNVPDNICFGLFHQANYTTDGKKYTATWIGIPGFPPGIPFPLKFTYIVLYTDYDTVEISYRCDSDPQGTTGICKTPFFWVNTRVPAAQLTAATKSFIAGKVSDLLRPYCLSADDLNFSPWDESLPICNPTPPAEFTSLVQTVSGSS